MFDHIGFNVGDFDRSLAFYWAVLAPLGIGVLDQGEGCGRDNGGPGLRPNHAPDYSVAFALDPNGHNVEAVTTAPEA